MAYTKTIIKSIKLDFLVLLTEQFSIYTHCINLEIIDLREVYKADLLCFLNAYPFEE